MSTDARKTAMMNSLRRLNIRQLTRIKTYAGVLNHNDKPYDETTGRFHFIAVGIGIPEIKGFIATETTVTRQLSFCRLSVKPLANIEGSFYLHPNEDRDLNVAINELIEEKRLEETA